MYYRVSWERYLIICVRSFSFARPTSFRKYKPVSDIQQSGSPKRTSADMELRNYPKLNIYLYNYQTETAIFLVGKKNKSMKKTTMVRSYLNFLKIFPSFWTFGQQYYKNESIHLNSWRHSHKKQKYGLETQVVFVDIVSWTWIIWSFCCFDVQKIHQNSKKW